MNLRDRMDRTWGLAAAALVIALLAGGVLVVTLGRSDEGNPEAIPTVPATGETSSTPTNARSSNTPRDTNQTIPLTTPTGVEWELFRGLALPKSAAAGPTRVSGPVHAGYARTPLGALIAMEQIGVRFFATADGGWRTVTEQQVVPGAGRDNYLRSRAGKGDLPVPSPGWAQYSGFRFVTYTTDVAAIQIVNRNPSGTLKVSTLSVRWVDGDWKLELQPEGTPETSVAPVDDLSGFIAFAGV